MTRLGIGERLADYWWAAKHLVVAPRTRKAYFAGLAAAQTEPTPAASQPLAFLLPGVYENDEYFFPLATALRVAGFRVVIDSTPGRNTKPVPTLASGCLEKIAAEEASAVVIIAHSKGGLVGRAILAARNRAGGDLLPQVAGMVTIATPWFGSLLATPWAAVPTLWRLRPVGSDLARPWGGAREAEIRRKIVAVRPSWDPHIPGAHGLPDAHNIQVQCAGHFRVLGAPETLEAVTRHALRFANLTDSD